MSCRRFCSAPAENWAAGPGLPVRIQPVDTVSCRHEWRRISDGADVKWGPGLRQVVVRACPPAHTRITSTWIVNDVQAREDFARRRR